MDYFLDYLVKKSDLNNNEYFNYRQSSKPKKTNTVKYTYEKIKEPSVNDYVVFDLETTGMKPGANSIIEIGAVKVINNNINGIFNVLVNPCTPIPGFITSLTHISNDMVMDKHPIDVILPDFVDFIGDLPLMAHNASFDMSFILAEAKRLNINISNPVVDTLQLSRKYNKECEKHSLGYLTKFFNINLKDAHRAYHDAMATQQLYSIIQKKVYKGVYQ